MNEQTLLTHTQSHSPSLRRISGGASARTRTGTASLLRTCRASRGTTATGRRHGIHGGWQAAARAG